MNSRKWVVLLTLALAGGTFYKLPYLQYTYYEPLKEVLNLTNTEMGLLLSVFGISSLIFYLPGGFIADRFQPKIILSMSFILFGIFSLIYSTFPSFEILVALHFLIGMVSTLLYWSVSIKAVNMLSRGSDVGLLFGVWEGGKQVSGFVLVGLALVLFETIPSTSLGITSVLRVYAVTYLVIGLALLFLIKNSDSIEKTAVTLKEIVGLIKDPRAWIFAGIIFTAYHFHISINLIKPYLITLFGLSAALVGSIYTMSKFGLGSFGSMFAGGIRDKIGSTTVLLNILICIMISCLLVFILAPINNTFAFVIAAVWVIAYFINYSLRGVYFTVISEFNVDKKQVGAFIGFASLFGYLPDAYFHIVKGMILDNNPGDLGYRLVFSYVLVLLIIALIVIRVSKKYTVNKKIS